MPIKKDDKGNRRVEMEFMTPGSPEQVWRAMATGDGFATWFTRAHIEERAGGALRFDFGDAGSTSGEVTTWEPPRRFAFVERNWNGDAPPVATEITITPRAGGQCVVRMVHSLFSSSDEWDDQIEGFEKGWPGFFEVLRVYLAHFAGLEGAAATAALPVEADQLTCWKKLTQGLGLEAADVGERRTAGAGAEVVSGLVERVHQDAKQRWILLRAQEPGAGVLLVGTYGTGASTNVSATVYAYGADAARRATASEGRWRAWLAATFE